MLSLIWAMSENRVIGRDNALPWHLPADLKYFRRITSGHPIIMGRKNYESIGRPLPNRQNIVVSRRHDYVAPGCVVVHSVDHALEVADAAKEIFIIGGASLYTATLDRAERLYLTQIHAQVDGDVLFPDFDRQAWREVWREDHAADAQHAHNFSFIVLERNQEK